MKWTRSRCLLSWRELKAASTSAPPPISTLEGWLTSGGARLHTHLCQDESQRQIPRSAGEWTNRPELLIFFFYVSRVPLLRGAKGQTKGQTGCCSCPGDGSCANVRVGGWALIISGGIPSLRTSQGSRAQLVLAPQQQGATLVGGHPTAWLPESPCSRQLMRQGLGYVSAESEALWLTLSAFFSSPGCTQVNLAPIDQKVEPWREMSDIISWKHLWLWSVTWRALFVSVSVCVFYDHLSVNALCSVQWHPYGKYSGR